MEKLPWIRVDGDRLVDATGTVVTLTGVGLGGWLNMENFITGYPGTESQQRRALHEAPVYTGEPERDASRLRLLRDQLDIYRSHGASWALWTYKDIGLQGLVYAAEQSPYRQRIAPVVAKKARLGADSWGGADRQVRHLLDPIEELFDREYPDFDPYPWGRRAWIHLLVRHILLAEPLVRDFGRCFEGVNPDEAERLAASFAFPACTRREALVETLRAHLATQR